MIPSAFPPKDEIARLTARALLEIKAVHFNAETPFTLASGLPSPTYIDCRKLISYPRIRSTLMDFLAVTVVREVLSIIFWTLSVIISLKYVAGILAVFAPFVLVAYITTMFASDIRFGMNKKDVPEVVEDLTTDGGSKLSFVDAIRETGASCGHTAVIFYYGIFPDTEAKLGAHGVKLHHLCTWWDVLAEARAQGAFDAGTLAEVESFLKAPRDWQEARKA